MSTASNDDAQKIAARLRSGSTTTTQPHAAVHTFFAPYPVVAMNYDAWFRHRMLFLAIVATALLFKLVFFRDLALANFDIPDGGAAAITRYINLRILLAIVLIALYLFSYLKRWHFGFVAWFAAGGAVAALISDYFNIYVMTAPHPPQWMFGILSLRIAVIVCLLVNAINVRRLPPLKPSH